MQFQMKRSLFDLIMVICELNWFFSGKINLSQRAYYEMILCNLCLSENVL